MNVHQGLRVLAFKAVEGSSFFSDDTGVTSIPLTFSSTLDALMGERVFGPA
jgi:hypothetical protein